MIFANNFANIFGKKIEVDCEQSVWYTVCKVCGLCNTSKDDPGGSMVSLREGIAMCLNEWPINNSLDGFARARKKGLGLLMKSAGKNSFYSFCGKNCKNLYLYFFGPGGPQKRILHCGRAGQLPAAGAAGNCYASIRCSIPRRSAKPGAGRASASAKEVCSFHAASSAAARSADACGFSRIGCSIPRCSRSASVAGGGRLADAAQEVVFPVPASRASYNSAGASERSACQPRQRVAKGDAASIGCSIPLSQEGVMRPGGYSSDPKFHVVDYAPMANGVKTITEEENKEIPVKIHRTVPKTIGFVFGSRSVPLHFSGIIARNFRIRINNFFIGSQGKKGVPGQIGCFNGQSSETVLNLGIIPHGKSGAKIIRIFGGGR